MEIALHKKEQTRRVTEGGRKGQNGAFTTTPARFIKRAIPTRRSLFGGKALWLIDEIGRKGCRNQAQGPGSDPPDHEPSLLGGWISPNYGGR